MSEDVGDLLKSIGLENLEYRELASKSRAQRARERLAPLTLPPPPEEADPAARRPGAMLTLALVSPLEGAGCSTVAALLGEALATMGRRALVVALGPEDSPAASPGWALGGPAAIARLAAGGARRLPFGSAAPEALERIEGAARAPDFLEARLAPLRGLRLDAVLLDAGARATAMTARALACAEAALVVLAADERSWAALPQTEALLERRLRRGRATARYLLNRFDARRSLDREVRAALSDALGGRLLPVAIQADVAVSQAGARGESLLTCAPDSQVAADLLAVAEALAPLAGGAREREGDTQWLAGGR